MKVLGEITQNAEEFKAKDDKIKTGRMFGGEYFNLCGAFILWRGCQMKHEWIAPY